MTLLGLDTQYNGECKSAPGARRGAHHKGKADQGPDAAIRRIPSITHVESEKPEKGPFTLLLVVSRRLEHLHSPRGF